MRKIIPPFLTLLLIAFSSLQGFAQCSGQANINGTGQQYLEICLGQSATLHSSANCMVLMNNNFNNGTIGSGWSANCAPMFNNPCGTDVDGTIYLWIGDASSFPRDLVTVDYPVDCPGSQISISFDMRFAVQAGGTPCEGPDEMDEGVSLQYSTNGGTSWTDITYFCPDGNQYPSNTWIGQSTAGGSGATNFTSWHNYSFTLPPAAISCNTRFRWHQEQVTDQYCDHWGIDNVNIFVSPLNSNVQWSLNGTPFSSDTVTIVTPPAPGIYNYILTGSSNCNCGVGGFSDTLVVKVNPIPAVTTTNATACPGQPATLTASGATTYAWNTGQTTASITVSPAASTTYTVTGTSAGCSNTATAVVTTNAPFTLTGSATDEHCGQADGTASVNVNGGTGPFNYNWSNGQNTQTINNLTFGNYTVTVTDAGGCSATASVTVNSIVGPSAPFGNITQETCTYGNGSISVNPVNGTPPYSFLWSSGQSTQSINNLSAGTYTVTITDQNGCTAVNSTTITNSPPPVLSLIDTTSAICGMTNGAAQISINGGTGPYSYMWSNGQTSQNLSGVLGGTYSVVVTDANSCKDTLTVVIGIVGGPVPATSFTDALCDRNDGTASVTATGGSGNYTYQWSNGLSGQTVSNLAPGTYTVTVDDGVCFQTAQVTIGNIPGPTAGFTFTPAIVNMEDPIYSFYDNSQGAVSWQWSFGDGSTTTLQNCQHTYLNAGTYEVVQIVTNEDGCTDSTMATILVKEIVALWVPNAFTPNENGINETFAPKGIGIDPDHFELYIYNRWGEMMFQSKSLSCQWDGKYNGNEVPQDVYVWVILYKGLDDIRYKKSGHVTVLK